MSKISPKIPKMIAIRKILGEDGDVSKDTATPMTIDKITDTS